jgi:[acyl-carrier-protein] S-malonyltransferase
MKIVFMFPGQSSRYPGLLDKLLRDGDGSRDVVAHASKLLGRDLVAHYRADNGSAFDRNRDVQIGVFLANHLFLRRLEAVGVVADGSLGLSLGEWNHLVHIGALGFEDALLAVEARGEAYDAGPAGAMASIFPMTVEELEEVVQRTHQGEVLEIVNLNSPRQQVLSGARSALDRALALLEAEHFVSAVVIEERVPMHSSLFAPVGARFRQSLERLPFRESRLSYLPNRLGEPVHDPDFVQLLSSHVHEPVLWRKSIDFVLGRWPDAFMLEVGPKRVLTNLLGRKWHGSVKKAPMDCRGDLDAQLADILSRIRGIEVDGAA